MLHVWLIPALVIFFLVVWGFYLLMKHRGGTGVRTPGRTVLDEPGNEDDAPPG